MLPTRHHHHTVHISESVEVADLQGVTHCTETSCLWVAWPSKIHILLTRLWRLQLHLHIVDTLVLKEADALACGFVVDVSSIVLKRNSIVIFDKLSDTKNGHFHFHMIEDHKCIFAVGLKVDSDGSEVMQQTTTCGFTNLSPCGSVGGSML